MRTSAINTVVGELQGRNAIYLDEVKDSFTPPSPLTFRGTLSAPCCTNYTGSVRFIPYELEFNSTPFFICCELDNYKKERFLSSSFCKVEDSQLLQEMAFSSDYQHYILATYDFIYEIVAKGFTMKIKG